MKTLQEFVQNIDGNQAKDVMSFWDQTSAFPIARASMPQVDVKNLQRVLDQLDINYIVMKDIPWNYRPTQTDFDEDKVNQLIQKLQSGDTFGPIIVSNDNFVLDGHHRYIAANMTATPIDVMTVDLPINKLLKLVTDIA